MKWLKKEANFSDSFSWNDMLLCVIDEKEFFLAFRERQSNLPAHL